MRNRFMIYRKGHSVASALLFVLLIAHLLLPPLAWLGSAAGFPLGNLFSSEGVRWYYLHIQDCYRSPFMAVVFPVVLVFGAIERSGLSEIIKDTISKGVLSLTYRQRKACLMAGTFLLLYLAGMLLLLLGPHAILLSVTGHLYPSPFVSGILQTMSLGFVLTSLLYAVLSFHLRGWQECLSVLYWGIQRYDVMDSYLHVGRAALQCLMLCMERSLKRMYGKFSRLKGASSLGILAKISILM